MTHKFILDRSKNNGLIAYYFATVCVCTCNTNLLIILHIWSIYIYIYIYMCNHTQNIFNIFKWRKSSYQNELYLKA